MLSIANIKSSSSASQYYYSGDYYAIDGQKTSWYGEGTDILNLKDEVKRDDLKNILDGIHPRSNEKLVGSNAKGHASGIDLTFSAPKSVSILVEVLGKDEIRKLHHKAVNNVLDYISNNLLKTRVKNAGETTTEDAHSMIVAKFDHATSRSDDPQFHTHCLLANLVQKDDKSWRTGYFKEIFVNKIFLGQIYRYELAKELQSEGYSIKNLKDDLTYEVDEISDKAINEFSTRAKQIKDSISKLDDVNAKIKAKAALITRENKGNNNLNDLKKEWLKQFSKIQDPTSIKTKKQNFDLESKDNSDLNEQSKSKNLTDTDFRKVMVSAIHHLSERKSVFSKEELLSSFMQLSLGNLSFVELHERSNKELEKMIFSGKLIFKSDKFTTEESLKKDREIVSIYRNSINTTKPIFNKISLSSINKDLEHSELNDGQINSIISILSTKDKISAIQGYAGTGKTYMLKHASKHLGSKGWQFIGLAPTSSASKELQSSININAHTLQAFLQKYDFCTKDKFSKSGMKMLKENFNKSILLVDEASLISSKQMVNLFKIAEKLETRIVLIGDKKQIESVEAGSPFYMLQQKGMNPTKMTKIIRQKDPELKNAVYLAIHSQIKDAFVKLGSNIFDGDNDIHKVASKIYFEKLKTSSSILVVSTSNELRYKINNEIRSQLILDGKLGEVHEVHDTFRSKNMTYIQKQNAIGYDKGDFVYFQKGIKELGIEKNVFCEILSKNIRNNTIDVKVNLSEQNQRVRINLDKLTDNQIDVFSQEKIDIHEGEKLRIRRNDKSFDFRNGDQLDIIEINKDFFKVKLNGESMIINRSSEKAAAMLRHVEYYYASTAYSAQSKTVDHVIAVIDSDSYFPANQKNFYVAISRAKHTASLVTNDSKKLSQKIERNTGNKDTFPDLDSHQSKDNVKQKNVFLKTLGLIKDSFRSQKIFQERYRSY